MKVRVGVSCNTCKYWGSHTGSCSYILMTQHSRLWDENGNRITKGYCDKYVEGTPNYDKSQWAREGRTKYEQFI